MMCVCLTTGEMRSGAGDWNGIKEPCRSLSRSVKQRNIDRQNKDASFLKIVSEVTGGHIVSAVYLTGDGFDGEWMKESLSFCAKAIVFMGKNLYSKGACYAAAENCMTEENSWQFVYMGDNEMKVNVSLKVQTREKTEFLR